jgi:hypothetical protein
MFSLRRSLKRQNAVLDGTVSGVLLHKHAQQVCSQPKVVPRHMIAVNRRFFKGGGKKQHLRMCPISQIIHSGKTVK